MRENKFQADLIKEMKKRWDNCIVLKNDPNYIQGVPDLAVFHNDKWAMLECKKGANEHHQPNQDYYVELMDNMSFARFIFPENKEEVLNAMGEFFET